MIAIAIGSPGITLYQVSQYFLHLFTEQNIVPPHDPNHITQARISGHTFGLAIKPFRLKQTAPE